MPLFISSFDMHSKGNMWFQAIQYGFLLALLLLGLWEIMWRCFGFSPVIEDDLGIWALRRLEVQQHDRPSIILLGSSRMQLDVDPQVLGKETGSGVTMLAIDGSTPLPVLEDIAENTDFDGTILCSLLPQWLADGNENRGRSAKWVRKFHQQKWSSWVETRLSILLQSSFAFRYPGLLPGELIRKLGEGEIPLPPYAPMRKDRYRPADYSMTDIEQLRSARINRQEEIVSSAEPLSENAFAARVSEIEGMVQKIKGRGGEVIFLRLPASGRILDLEEQAWPREKYWDRFAAQISARTIHYADYQSLSSFDCPDGSHLGFRDAEIFTRALAALLALR